MHLKTSYRMKPPVSVRLDTGHPLADKLVACYLLNEGSGVKAFDSSGRGHHGTLTGGATWTTGKFGRAVDFDGTDGRIVIADHDDFTPALHSFSIAATIFMHDASGFRIVSKGLLNTDGEWLLETVGADYLRVYLFDNSEAACFIGRVSDNKLTAYENTWLHIVVTCNGGTLSSGINFYLNAITEPSKAGESNAGSFDGIENLTAPVRIGRYSTNHADGLIDNLMFWRRVLTQSDVNKLFADRFCMFEKRLRALVSVPE